MDAKTPAIDALLVHRTFLAGLARSLLRDEAAAEDVVQETYVRALKSPPTERGQLRSWLATVTRNLAAERGRREPKVRRWETHAARPEGSVPSPAEIAEREAVRRQVVEALMELDDPSRDVLLLRFYEDLAPRHIARELGLPVETVRTRIKRGLAKLRDKLDTGHGGQRHAWAVALLPLAFPRKAAASTFSKLLGHAGQAAAPTTALKAAVLVTIALFVMGWWWGPWSEGGGSEPGFDNAVGGVAPESPGELLIGHEHDDPAGAPAVASLHVEATRLLAPPAEPVAPQLRGVVLAPDGSTALAGAPLFLGGIALDDWAQLLTPDGNAKDQPWELFETTADAAGGYDFVGLTQGAWIVASPGDALSSLQMHAVVLVGADVVVRTSVWAGMRQLAERFDADPLPVYSVALDGTLDLPVTRAAFGQPLSVRVIDERGRCLPGAEVLHLPDEAAILTAEIHLSPAELDELASVCTRITVGAQGDAMLPVAGGGGELLVRSEGHALRRVPVPAGPIDGPFEIVLSAAAPIRVRGRVEDEHGDGVPGLDVWLCTRANEYISAESLRRVRDEHDRPRVVTGADGSFTFDAVSRLGSSTWKPDAVTATSPVIACAVRDGFLPAVAEVRRSKVTGETEEVELVLVPGGELDVFVLDAEGEPFTGVVGVSRPGVESVSLSWGSSDGHHHWGAQRHGPLSFQLSHDIVNAQTQDIDWQGEPVHLRFDPPPPSWPLQVVLRDPVGRPVDEKLPTDFEGGVFPERVTVSAYPSDPADLYPTEGSQLADAGRWAYGAARASPRDDGVWVFALDDDWPSAEAWVVVWAGGRSQSVTRIERDTEELHLTVDTARLGDQVSRLTVRPVEAGTGESVTGHVLLLDPTTGAPVERMNSVFIDGRIQDEIARPGTYDLRVVVPGRAFAMVEGVTLEAGEHLGPIEVRVGPESVVAVNATRPAGTPADTPIFVRVFDTRGRHVAGRNLTGASGDIGGLAAGSYLVHGSTRDGGSMSTWVDLVEGGKATAELPLERGGALVLGLSESRADVWTGGQLAVTDDGGRRLLDFWFDAEEGRALADAPRRYGLRPGRYRVQAYGLGFAPIDRLVTIGNGDVDFRID